MSAEKTSSLTAQICQQLSLLSQSQRYILYIIVGVVISYVLTGEQHRQLLCSALGTPLPSVDTFPFRLLSSLLILSALIFFFQVSKTTAETPAETCVQNTSHQVNMLASGLVLTAGILRLWDLLCLQTPTAQA